MLNLSIIQKYILLATGMPNSTPRLWLASVGTTDETLATSTDDGIKGNVPGKVITKKGEGIQNSDELATTSDSDAGDKSAAAAPPASSSSDDSNILII